MKDKTTAKETLWQKRPWPDRIKKEWPGDCEATWQEPILEKGNCHRKIWIPAIHDWTGKRLVWFGFFV